MAKYKLTTIDQSNAVVLEGDEFQLIEYLIQQLNNKNEKTWSPTNRYDENPSI